MSEIRLLSGPAFASAIKEGSTLVDFVASCCPPSEYRGRLLGELNRSAGGRLSVVRVDLDENSDMVRSLGIAVLPALMFFQDGTPQWATLGEVTTEQLLQFLEPVLLS